MFCFQCEQASRQSDQAGCRGSKGICGKDEITSDFQDLLIYQLKGLGELSARLHRCNKPNQSADNFILYALFSTLTNVNFNRSVFLGLIAEAECWRTRLLSALKDVKADMQSLTTAVYFTPAEDFSGLIAQANLISIRAGQSRVGEDIIGLRALVLYGLKGVAAYAHHAEVLGRISANIHRDIAYTLDFLAHNPADTDALLEEAVAIGHLNLRVMALLETANTSTFGVPVPTQVGTTPVQGKAILVSGHDLRDLYKILEATKGTGINVYTHGEMLPAHGYPQLHAYPHLVGNYGSAWQNQQQEFADFPGAIVMTSNCLIEPKPSYHNRMFTTGPVGWPGLRHIRNDDYRQLLDVARSLPGYPETITGRNLLVGFGRETILNAADALVESVMTGEIRHFFLIGGCDGPTPGRNYYTEFAEHAPKNTILMTQGCGKYRFNDQEFGQIGSLPRLMDVGQCNDSYAAIQIARTLARAFGCEVNDLPLTFVISWLEQKAASVLLTLMALGLRNVRLGPSMPAFLTPTILEILTTRFGIQPITSAEADIEAALHRAA